MARGDQLLSHVALPNVFKRLRQGVVDDFPLGMAGTFRIDKLVGVALVLENPGEARVGGDPVSAIRGRGLYAIVVLGDLEPETQRLLLGFGEQILDVFVGAERGFGAVAEIDEGAGVGEDAVVEVGPEPGHGERGRSAGTAAEGHAGFGVLGQLDARFFLGAGQDFVFDELDVLGGDGVVFHAALRTTVVDHDGNHYG